MTQFRIAFKKNASRTLKETRTQRHATLCKAWRSLANTRRHTHENLFDLSGDYSRKWNEWVEYSPWLPSEYVNGQNVPYCSRKSRSQWWPPRSWHTPEFQWRHSPDSPLTHPPHPPPPAPKKLATLPLRIFIVFSGPKTPPFTTQIFPRALPKEFWTAKKCRLENPRSSLWLRQNSQNLSGGQAKGKPHGKWGVFSQIFPQSSAQGILERK